METEGKKITRNKKRSGVTVGSPSDPHLIETMPSEHETHRTRGRQVRTIWLPHCQQGWKEGNKSLDRNFILLDEMEWNWDDWSNVFCVSVKMFRRICGSLSISFQVSPNTREAGSTDYYLFMW